MEFNSNVVGEINYQKSGVDIHKADSMVEKLKEKALRSYGPRVYEGIGGFASLYEIADDKLLASGTDGVGTKLKVASHLQKYDTLGIDLVAMCVNDILCVGACPLFFLDYMALGKLKPMIADSLLEGILKGCELSEMPLIGGETAEMPGVYGEDDFDLAGFAVGEVMKEDLLPAKNIKPGDQIFGLKSTGPHSNGFSLLRKLISPDEKELLQFALTPTEIYWPWVKDLIQESKVKALAHITGGGVRNISRISQKFDYVLNSWPLQEKNQVNDFFQLMLKRSGSTLFNFLETFNMGIGMVMICDKDTDPTSFLGDYRGGLYHLGEVKAGAGKVHVQGPGSELIF